MAVYIKIKMTTVVPAVTDKYDKVTTPSAVREQSFSISADTIEDAIIKAQQALTVLG